MENEATDLFSRIANYTCPICGDRQKLSKLGKTARKKSEIRSHRTMQCNTCNSEIALWMNLRAFIIVPLSFVAFALSGFISWEICMTSGMILETPSVNRGPGPHPLAMFPLLFLFFGMFALLLQRLNRVTVIRIGEKANQ